jgi:hypothetical protein
LPTVHFLGRILPSSVKISFTDIPKAKWEWVETGLSLAFVVHITESVIDVECSLDHYQDDYMAELHRRAFDLARACVNVAAFGTGFGVFVFFDKFIGPNGIPADLLFTNPHLVGESTAFKMNPVTIDEKRDLEKILGIVMTEPGLFMALNDLIQGVSVLHMTPTNCGRVVDALRKLVTPGIEPKQGWPIFQQIFKVDEPYLTFISEHSKKPRHGEHIRIDGPTTTEIAKRTWIIMNRFLEYRKRGNQPLPLVEFPLLKG